MSKNGMLCRTIQRAKLLRIAEIDNQLHRPRRAKSYCTSGPVNNRAPSRNVRHAALKPTKPVGYDESTQILACRTALPAVKRRSIKARLRSGRDRWPALFT